MASATTGTSRQRVLRDVSLGFMRAHVLHHCAEGPVYGLDMMEELRRHGYRVGPGTLYPMLHSLEQAGFLRSAHQVVDGKTRRYYRTTRNGQRLLNDLRARIGEVADELLASRSAPG
jgi:DNA-binding PadR family transcriptional regulator